MRMAAMCCLTVGVRGLASECLNVRPAFREITKHFSVDERQMRCLSLCELFGTISCALSGTIGLSFEACAILE